MKSVRNRVGDFSASVSLGGRGGSIGGPGSGEDVVKALTEEGALRGYSPGEVSDLLGLVSSDWIKHPIKAGLKGVVSDPEHAALSDMNTIANQMSNNLYLRGTGESMWYWAREAAASKNPAIRGVANAVLSKDFGAAKSLLEKVEFASLGKAQQAHHTALSTLLRGMGDGNPDRAKIMMEGFDAASKAASVAGAAANTSVPTPAASSAPPAPPPPRPVSPAVASNAPPVSVAAPPPPAAAPATTAAEEGVDLSRRMFLKKGAGTTYLTVAQPSKIIGGGGASDAANFIANSEIHPTAIAHGAESLIEGLTPDTVDSRVIGAAMRAITRAGIDPRSITAGVVDGSLAPVIAEATARWNAVDEGLAGLLGREPQLGGKLPPPPAATPPTPAVAPAPTAPPAPPPAPPLPVAPAAAVEEGVDLSRRMFLKKGTGAAAGVAMPGKGATPAAGTTGTLAERVLADTLTGPEGKLIKTLADNAAENEDMGSLLGPIDGYGALSASDKFRLVKKLWWGGKTEAENDPYLVRDMIVAESHNPESAKAIMREVAKSNPDIIPDTVDLLRSSPYLTGTEFRNLTGFLKDAGIHTEPPSSPAPPPPPAAPAAPPPRPVSPTVAAEAPRAPVVAPPSPIAPPAAVPAMAAEEGVDLSRRMFLKKGAGATAGMVAPGKRAPAAGDTGTLADRIIRGTLTKPEQNLVDRIIRRGADEEDISILTDAIDGFNDLSPADKISVLVKTWGGNDPEIITNPYFMRSVITMESRGDEKTAVDTVKGLWDVFSKAPPNKIDEAENLLAYGEYGDPDVIGRAIPGVAEIIARENPWQIPDIPSGGPKTVTHEAPIAPASPKAPAAPKAAAPANGILSAGPDVVGSKAWRDRAFMRPQGPTDAEWAKMGGYKAKIAWLESQGRVGGGGPQGAVNPPHIGKGLPIKLPLKPPEGATNLVPRKPDGTVGPYEDMTPAQQLDHVMRGTKPAMLYDGNTSAVNKLAKKAEDTGLPYKIVWDEPGTRVGRGKYGTVYVGKDQAALDLVLKHSRKGGTLDDAGLGRALGYTEADIAAYTKANPPPKGLVGKALAKKGPKWYSSGKETDPETLIFGGADWNADMDRNRGPHARVTTGDPDTWTLEWMKVPKSEQGSGKGRQLLDEVLRDADAKGKRVTLVPNDILKGEGGLTRSDLVKWYGRHGFKGVDKDSNVMVREPNGPTPPAPAPLATAAGSNKALIHGRTYGVGEVVSEGPHKGQKVIEIEDGVPTLSKGPSKGLVGKSYGEGTKKASSMPGRPDPIRPEPDYSKFQVKYNPTMKVWQVFDDTGGYQVLRGTKEQALQYIEGLKTWKVHRDIEGVRANNVLGQVEAEIRGEVEKTLPHPEVKGFKLKFVRGGSYYDPSTNTANLSAEDLAEHTDTIAHELAHALSLHSFPGTSRGKGYVMLSPGKVAEVNPRLRQHTTKNIDVRARYDKDEHLFQTAMQSLENNPKILAALRKAREAFKGIVKDRKFNEPWDRQLWKKTGVHNK